MPEETPELPTNPPEPQLEAPSLMDKLKIHKWKVLVGVLSLLALAGTAFGAYLLIQDRAQPVTTPPPTQTPTPTPKPEPTNTQDKTTNWKTYTNTKWDFQISYPPSWDLNGNAESNQISLASQEKTLDGSAKFLIDLTVWGRTPDITDLKEEARFKGEEIGDCSGGPNMGICAPEQPKQINETYTDHIPLLYSVTKASGKKMALIPIQKSTERVVLIDTILWPEGESYEVFDLVLLTFKFLAESGQPSASVDTFNGRCASGDQISGTISVQDQTIKFAGTITPTATPCEIPDAFLEQNGSEITVLLTTSGSSTLCDQCIGAIDFSGNITGLSEGRYNVQLIYKKTAESEVILDQKTVSIN